MQMWTKYLFTFPLQPVHVMDQISNEELKENLYLPYLCFHVKGFCFFLRGLFILSVNFFPNPFPTVSVRF